MGSGYELHTETTIVFVTMKRCSLCNCSLPEDSTKRRRLHGTSSSFALQAFLEVSLRAGLGSVVPREDKGADGPFLCLACHSQLEKVSKLKANLAFLTEDVERKLKQTATSLNVITPSGIPFGEKLCQIYYYVVIELDEQMIPYQKVA